MKKTFQLLITSRSVIFLVLIGLLMDPATGQKRGLASITRSDLQMHMDFLASDELQGRSTGESGLETAARYLAVQAEHLGLRPADPDGDYMQYYTILEKEYNRETSGITIRTGEKGSVVVKDPFYVFPAPEQSHTSFGGEVVFAGYGIKDDEHGYNDFEGIEIRDRVVLIMNRAPMNEEGTQMLFDHEKWSGMQSFQHKMPYIYSQQPRAVLLVFDPKSGVRSIGDINPGIEQYLGRSRELERDHEETQPSSVERLSLVLIHRNVADSLLAGTGKSLEELQKQIDRTQDPQSFLVEDCTVEIEVNMKRSDLVVPNVFGMIPGTDPGMTGEMIIYVAHFDHVGTDGHDGVFNGADDNASGTVALIEMAEAFMKEKRPPRRSIGFLWVSAEEIGLFGSRYFAENPLVPLETISAVINLDMVGRSKSEEDVASGRRDLTIVGGDTVKVIGGKQSSVLMEINQKTLEEMGMQGNYDYNDLNHPERYFYRSDHINFAMKDIPVLFYSTGTHTDYHQVTDVPGRIDYDKFLRMTRFCFKAGYNTAQYKGPIEVDNPYSTW